MRLHMKWVFAAGVFLGLGATGAASAADMAVKARPVAPPIMYNWQGCYIGGNLGAGWSKMDTTQVGDDALGPVFNDYGREKDSAFIGGAQAGCDFMAGNNLVFGVQGMGDFGSISGRHSLPSFPTFSETNNLNDIISATGRIGYLWTPQLLGYGKVGVAYLHDKNTVYLPSGAPFVSSTFTLPAMTAGVGFEWMFTPNWSVFAEWNYYWIEDDAAQHFTPAPGFVGETLNTRQRVQTALVGVNYKFHWDNGPVVAKY
jgi:outer membrane immunogenic protein